MAAAGVAAQGPVPVAGRNVNINGGPAAIEGEPGNLRYIGDFNNKMQNEGVCAANPLKPSDLICAFNNYSQVVEVAGDDEGKITRDSTIGVAQSRDLGGHWVSEFLPGASYLDSRTSLPNGNPVTLAPYRFHAAADAGVVATPGGLAHVSAIFFKGSQANGTLTNTGAIAVTTLIDPLNDDGNASPYLYVWQRIVMLGTDQNGGTFIDKPWLARGESKTGTCSIPIKPGVTKTVDAYPLYLTWAVFTGLTDDDNNTKLYFSRSLNCGSSWSTPKILTSGGVNQAPVVSVQPGTNNIDLAWRQFGPPADPTKTDAIRWTRSTNGGWSFRTPSTIAEICPFTQGTSQATFRINTFPTIASSPSGVYVGWSDRRDPVTNVCTGDALVRWSFYNTGSWSAPAIIEDPRALPTADTLPDPVGNHQIQPAFAFSNGTLGATWYDFRNDKATIRSSSAISEAGQTFRHTVDLRAALANVNSHTGQPTWGPSAEISRFARGVRSGDPGAGEVQLQYNRPNMRMFRLAPGTPPDQRGVPFFSDYIHLAPLQQAVPTSGHDDDDDHHDGDHGVESWGQYPQPQANGTSPYFFATWTDTRDALNVKLPSFVSPLSEACTTEPRENTKTLDMNLYGAVVTKGVILAYSPSGSRPLGMFDTLGAPIPRTFVVVVRNTSMGTTNVRLVARQPVGGTAVFVPDAAAQIGNPNPIQIPRLSSISRTVEVSPNGPGTLASNAVVIVDVYEPASAASPTHTVFMNTDPYPIALAIPPGGADPNTTEVHTPVIDGDIRVSPILVSAPEIDSPEIDSPEIDSPEIDSPEIDSLNVLSPEIDSPEIDSPEIDSPEIDSPEIDSAGIRDISYVVQNAGNEWTSFRTRALADGIDPDLYQIQLLIWNQYNTKNVGCGTALVANNQVAVNINNADVTNQTVDAFSVQNATVAVGPGESYVVTLRIRALEGTNVPDFSNNTGMVVTSEATNTGAGDTRPTLNLPASLPVVAEATSPAGAPVAFEVSTNEGSTVTCTPESGSTFPLGATRVTCVATNAQNDTTTGSFTVLVNDSTPPTIAPHGDETFEATSAAGAVVTYTSPATLDASDGAGLASCSPASGSTFALGDTVVTCNATDSNENLAASTNFVVHVVDTTKPTIAPHLDETAEATSAAGAVVAYTSPSTADAIDGPGTASCSPVSGSTFALGDTPVTCNATDAHGNVATSTSFVVHVRDTTPPTIGDNPDLGPLDATGPLGRIVSFSNPAASDLVDPSVAVVCASASGLVSGSMFPIGTTVVICTATDDAGLMAVSSFNVTIAELQAKLTFQRADVWFTNSKSYSTKFDLKAEVLKNGDVVATKTLSNTTLGYGTDFAQATYKQIASPSTSSEVSFGSSDTLSLRVSIKLSNVIGAPSSAGIKLYYNVPTPPGNDSHLHAKVGATDAKYFMIKSPTATLGLQKNGSVVGPRESIAFTVTSKTVYTALGTWSMTGP
jgi:hypothetical protein